MEKFIIAERKLTLGNLLSNRTYPLWLKILCLINTLFFILTICAFVFWDISPNFRISAFGLSTNKIYSPLGLFLLGAIFLNYYASYKILFERKNATNIGIFTSFIGIILCVFSMFILPILSKSYSFTPQFEILILIIIYKKLKEIKKHKQPC